MDWAFVAEDADAYQELGPSVEREARDDVVFVHARSGEPWSNLATRVRFTSESISGGIAAVRVWFHGRAVEEFRWLIGPSATPTDAIALLLAKGARRDEAEPELTAMVLDRAPPAMPEIPVREVSSLRDFVEMERVRTEVFGGGSPARTDDLEVRWKQFSATGGMNAYLAELEGEAVAYGVMRRTDPGPRLLGGGVTLPKARGRGAYRALVRARWEAAMALGAPALVTQAQAASRPILERLGFRAAGSIAVLVDHSIARPP